MKAISFNGGKESLIILHKFYKKIKIIFRIEDENDFPELINYISYMSIYFNINILVFKDMKNCINILKEKYNIDTVILGCRRTDPKCLDLKEIQATDKDWPYILRYNPLLDWSYKDVWGYIKENDLPVCSLYENGYTSIGNKLNTFPNYKLFQNNKFIHGQYLKDNNSEREGRIKSKLPITESGKVIRGKGLGKGLGFLTANLDTNLNIDEGVYYGYCILKEIKYTMVMSVGTNPQFQDKSLEVHILNKFENDFYDEIIKIEIIGFIRKMKKYDSLKKLINDIEKDILIAKYLL